VLIAHSCRFGGEIKNWNITDRLHEIKVPTLVINGRYDLAQDYVVKDFARLIPGARWVTFNKSSHSPQWEERPLLMATVQKFLAV
jgi:pimeloyl-ACP methyl ester carboxylesterase